MPKFKFQSEIQNPNNQTNSFDIEPFGVDLAFACLPKLWRRQGF